MPDVAESINALSDKVEATSVESRNMIMAHIDTKFAEHLQDMQHIQQLLEDTRTEMRAYAGSAIVETLKGLGKFAPQGTSRALEEALESEMSKFLLSIFQR